MVVWRGNDKLVAISIDNAPGDGMELTPDFHFAGNPRISARLAWRTLVEQLELSTAMIVGNAMSRAYLGQRRPMTSAVRAALRALVRDEAETVCALDSDETERLYNHVYSYLDRLFSHSTVATMTRTLAEDLRRERRLTAAEVLDRLLPLSNL